MYFDDRLATVLRIRANGALAQRTQFRQLADLLGTLPSDARGDLVDEAWGRLAELAQAIPPHDRAAAVLEPGLRLRSPRLVAELAQSDPAVASAAIRAARLAETQWLDLVPALPVPARGFLRQRSDLGPRVMAMLERLGVAPQALPAAGEVRQVAANDAANDEDTPSTPIQTDAQETPGEGIGAIVQRIEAFRKRKADGTPPTRGPAQPDGPAPVATTPVAAFAFACDEMGRITWADPAVIGAVSGMRIAASDDTSPAQSTAEVIAAFRRRQPLRGGRITLTGAPAIAGDWQVDATPQFDRLGHFSGYQGRFRRHAPLAPADAEGKPDEADRVRQLLHELRTPVNAIQGFAEVIQQQLFGPTPHEYRAHAATIAGDAARMLAGFDELERLARLETGILVLEPGPCDLGYAASSTVQQLNRYLEQRGCGFDLVMEPGPARVNLSEAEAERVAWRLFATLASQAAPGEHLRVRLKHRRGMIRLTLALPAALASQDDIFRATSTSPGTLTAGMFGTGFSLRLAVAEARAAGGSLTRREHKLRLEIPEAMADRATPPAGYDQSAGLAS